MAVNPKKYVPPHQHSIRDIVDGKISFTGIKTASNSNIDWTSIPYIHVKGNSYFYSQTEITGECPTFSWAELEPYLWGFNGGGEWTPDDLTLPLGDAYLRFTNTESDAIDIGLIYNSMDASPILYISQHLMVKKDFSAVAVTAFQGVLQLGSGYEAQGDMPQIILAHSEAAYGTKDILEINRSTGALGKLKCDTIYVDNIKNVAGTDLDITAFLDSDMLTLPIGINLEDTNVKIYRPTDGSTANQNSVRVQTPSDGALIVEQALFSKSLVVEHTGTFGESLVINYSTPYLSFQISDTDKAHIGVDASENLYLSALGSGDLNLSAASGVINIANDTVHTGDLVINKSNPSMAFQVSGANKLQLGYDNTYGIAAISSVGCYLNIASGSGDIVLYPASNLRLFGGTHFNPENSNTGQIGESGLHWYKGYFGSIYTDNLCKLDGSAWSLGGGGGDATFTSILLTSPIVALAVGSVSQDYFELMVNQYSPVNFFAVGRGFYFNTPEGYGVTINRTLYVDTIKKVDGSSWDFGSGGGNPFDQELNTDDDAKFATVLCTNGTGSVKCGATSASTALALGYDSTDTYITAYSRDLNLSSTSGVINIANDTVHTGDLVINKSNPSMAFQVSTVNKLQLGYNGSDSFISSVGCNLSIAAASGYDLILYPPNDHNVIVWNGRHIIPQSANGGQIGNSTYYWYASYVNNVYGKNPYTFGCERSKSDQEWLRKFTTREQAEEALTHQVTKNRRHTHYDPKDESKIICTCGKSGVGPCPEHEAEWNDLYAVHLGDCVEASSILILELDAELIKTQTELSTLKEKFETLQEEITLLKKQKTAA
jgi:hypothetical protein